MKDCIFCKIIKGEIPSYKVYEDDFVYAFLDINPSFPGHTLVIPKKHSENIFDIEKDDLERVVMASKKISQKMKSLGCSGINIYNNNGKKSGQIVFHFHMHIVPRDMSSDSFENIVNKLKIEG
jgi:histidine triad (HIT) family protein